MFGGFIDNVFKLHGMPVSMVSDRDRIFTSNFWQALFKSLGVKLNMSTAHHPQSDGQTERVNQCLEAYFRNMAFNEPKKWCSWLAMAEWWFNTSYHTATKFTPFQCLYGFPPQIGEVFISGPTDIEAVSFLQQKGQIQQQLKHNLLVAQQRMKKYANRNKSDRQFQGGEMVYLKIQPY